MGIRVIRVAKQRMYVGTGIAELQVCAIHRDGKLQRGEGRHVRITRTLLTTGASGASSL